MLVLISIVFWLAVILYEMLAGQLPFGNRVPVALFQQQLDSPLTPVSEYNPAVPPPIEKALTKALKLEPANRFASATKMSHALRPLAPELALVPERVCGQARWLPRFRMASWLLALLLLSVGLLLWFNLSRTLTTPATSESSGEEIVIAEEEEEEEEQEQEQEQIIAEFSNYGGQLWPVVAGNPHQTRFVDADLLPFHSDPSWVYNAAINNEEMGLVAGAERLIVAQARKVLALDWMSGELLWEAEFDAEVTPTPSIYADEEQALLLVATDKGGLYGLNLADGEMIWHIKGEELAGSIVGGVTTISYENLSYAVTDQGWLYALNPLTRKNYWSLDFSADKYDFVQPPTATKLALFLVSRDGRILTIDLATQQLVWIPTMIAYDAFGCARCHGTGGRWHQRRLATSLFHHVRARGVAS